mgnify:FL=1
MTALTARKTAKDHAAKAALRDLCQRDLQVLAKRFVFDDAHIPMSQAFHEPICQFAKTTRWQKNLYMVPRDHYKTGLLTVTQNIQRILINPNVRILIASNKAENAEAMLSELKMRLQSPALLALFPDILYPNPEKDAPVWRTGAIRVRRTSKAKEETVETTGMEGEITSKHYDHITYDDLVGEKNSQTREQVQATIDWWQKSQGLTQPWTTQDIIGTPWHYADLYMYLVGKRDKGEMALGVYRRACWEPDPRGVDVPRYGRVAPTFPERYTIHTLLEKRRDQGPSVFAAQYLIDPIDEETAVFPLSKQVVRPRASFPGYPTHDALWKVMTVDPAISTKGWADYSAIAVVGFDHENRMYVLDLRRDRWPESQLIKEIYDAYARTPGIMAIGIEAVGFQKMLFHLLQREAEKRGGLYLPAMKLERDTKITKNTRIRALEPLWSAGEVILADDLAAKDDFLEEAARFRLTKESTHDDMLDALADCLQLRVRPHAPDPVTQALAHLEPADQERERYYRDAQRQREAASAPPLDPASLRMSYAIQRRSQQAEEARQYAVAGVGEDDW